MITKEAEDQSRFVRSGSFTPPIQNTIFTTSARSAFKKILSHLNLQNTQKLLLPAYIGITDKEGSGVFDPVRETNTSYELYPLNDQLGVDQTALEDRLKSGQFTALLIIHYFGFTQNDMDWISSKCKQYHVTLIEDCAHALGSKQGGKLLGTFGDYSFFSIHKIIASNNGGLLKSNNVQVPIPEMNEGEEQLSEDTITQYIGTDFGAIKEIKRRNYQYLLSQISTIDHLTILYPALDEGIIPLNFPILVRNEKREELYFKLQEKGAITCALYYRMIDKIDHKTHPLSYQISDSILNLPVHQDTSIEDLDFFLKQLHNALEEI